MAEPDAVDDQTADEQTAEDDQADAPAYHGGYAPDTIPWYLSWGIPGRGSGRPWR
jgi:hypothetical protein